jgi:hypothetical protein
MAPSYDKRADTARRLSPDKNSRQVGLLGAPLRALLQMLEPQVLFALALLKRCLHNCNLRFQFGREALLQRSEMARLLRDRVCDATYALFGSCRIY